MSQSLIQTLNDLLVSELAASNRCLAHAELCDESGYERLLEAHERRAQQEMAHARALIGRLISLRARPLPTREEPIGVEPDVVQQILSDLRSSEQAVAAYQQGIRLATESGDQSTCEILQTILREEERQLSWLRTQETELTQLGPQAYLQQQA